MDQDNYDVYEKLYEFYTGDKLSEETAKGIFSNGLKKALNDLLFGLDEEVKKELIGTFTDNYTLIDLFTELQNFYTKEYIILKLLKQTNLEFAEAIKSKGFKDGFSEDDVAKAIVDIKFDSEKVINDFLEKKDS